MTTALDWLRPHPVEPVRPEQARPDEGLSGLLLPGRAAAGPADRGGPAQAAVRAVSCASDLPDGVVLCRGTALWVHTGRYRPRHVEAADPSGRRLPRGPRRCHSARLDEGDVVVLGGVGVTSPARTGADLARFWPVGRAADGLLALRAAGLDLQAVVALLDSYGTRPHVRRARELLRVLAPQPAAASLSAAARVPVMR